MSKRGQAAPAAVFVAIVAVLLIAFVVLIPPEQRADLLDDDENTSRTIEDTKVDENLLLVNPGRVDFLAQREIEHPLPVVNIFSRTEATTLAEKSLTYLKRGVFSEDITPMRFSLTDLPNTENVLLSFSITDSKGRLIISLNGEEIYDNEVQKGNIIPLKLSKSSLLEQNELQFTVSSPGLAFWSTNRVTLQNIKVIAEVKNVNAQMSRNIFLVSETEKANLERVKLKFQPGCTYGKVGPLTVTVNGNEVYAAVPDCDLSLIPIEFSPDLVHQGENQIIFKTEEGTYVLSHIVIESQLKTVDFPTYYFELSEEQFNDITQGKQRVRLNMDFVDVVTLKSGELVFNGVLRHFDTKEVSFTLDVSDDVVRGNNALKVKPRKTVEIRELRFNLVD